MLFYVKMPKSKRGRPRKSVSLNDHEREWIKTAYYRGANKYLISRCFHVDPAEVSSFCDIYVPYRPANIVRSFEEVFLRTFSEKVRLLMNEWSRKLKPTSVACYHCRLQTLWGAVDCDLNWCIHNRKEEVEKHLTTVSNTVITGTWNGEWCKDLNYDPDSIVTLINAPDEAKDIKFPYHHFKTVLTYPETHEVKM